MSSFTYSDKLRVRACGLLVEQGKVLLINLLSPVSKKTIWTAPGGGVEFGESLKETVKREFREETGLQVQVKDLVFINELIDAPFHAIEFFFEVERVSGELSLGQDPEHSKDEQLLKGLKFFSAEELAREKNVKPSILKNLFEPKEEGLAVRTSFTQNGQ